MTGTFIGEHSPTPSTPSSVNTRTRAVRVFSGYALTSAIFMRGDSMALRVALLAVLVLVTSAVPAGAQTTPRPGGVLKLAMIGEPPTLDTHTTTATIAY